MNTDVYISFQINVFVFWGKFPKWTYLIGLYGSSIFNFLRKLHIVSIVAEKFTSHQYCTRIIFSPHACQYVLLSSVQFSHSVMSNSFQPHVLQHTRPPCPSQTPGVYSDSCPLSQWCHPTISSCVIPFFSCLQSFPVSGSFQISQFFTSGGQSIGVSASTSVLPMNSQDWFPLGLTGWISLQSNGLARVFSNTTVQKHFSSAFFMVQLTHPYMTTGKTKAFTRWTFVGKVMPLLFNMLSRFVKTFHPRSNCLLISWLQSTSAVILEPKT